jgi:ribosomal protein S9
MKLVVSGKRKSSIARAVISEGSEKITINNKKRRVFYGLIQFVYC